MSYFAETLRQYRIRRGMSQLSLAELVGLSRFTIWKYENDYTTPSVEILEQLADVLNIAPSTLVKGQRSGK